MADNTLAMNERGHWMYVCGKLVRVVFIHYQSLSGIIKGKAIHLLIINKMFNLSGEQMSQGSNATQ